MKRAIGIFAALGVLLAVLLPLLLKDGVKKPAADVSSALALREKQTAPAGSYGEYLTRYEQKAESSPRASGGITLLAADAARDHNALAWKVSLPAEGLHYIRVRYTPRPQNESGGALVSLRLNGEIPYRELDSAELPDEYRDVLPIVQDRFGNDLRPAQVTADRATENYLFDSACAYTRPLAVYLDAKTSEIRLETIEGSPDIEAVVLEPESAVRSYAEIKEEYRQKEYTEIADRLELVPGQNAAYKSATTIYPVSDRSSPATDPRSGGVVKLNCIGGAQWKKAGDYVAWNVNAPQSGLYKISLRARQNTAVGAVSARSLYINGKLPFEEARVITVPYASKWQTVTLGKGGEDWLFYLNQGENEIRLTATLGDMDTVIRLTDHTAVALNDIYRKFMIVMGAVPDRLRDYRLELLCADEIAALKEQADTLSVCAGWLEAYSGKGNNGAALMRTMIRQLVRMHGEPDRIPAEFSYFKTNIGSLSTWSNNAKLQPLAIDVLGVGGKTGDMPKADAGFFANLKFGVSKFLYSYSASYQNMGELSAQPLTDSRPLTVWIGGGREQAQIVRNMTVKTFTKNTGTPVQIQLVQAPLLSATVAGAGPDAVIQSAPDVFNFAMRNAAVPLSAFPDYQKISGRFDKSLFIPFTYLGQVYALPETISFPILYYRKDVLKELGVEVPETWDDVITLSSVLSKNNMDFGLPSDATYLMSMFMTMYKQQGLEVYADGGKYSLLDSVEAINVFRFHTNLYANYGFPLDYNFLNRFRTGEMPIGVSGFAFYNEIPIAAPEINDLWGIAQIPGTRKADGSIDRTAVSGASGTMILASSAKRKEAWEFIKWWTSAETQSEFAAEIEGLMGPSARYSSANLEAFQKSSWPRECKAVFGEQMKHLTAIENVPGSYFLNRNLTNAFRSVVYRGTSPTDALYDYTYKINQEITQKRKEFGLSVRD